MIDRKTKFYVTTPIYYVTAKPHLGSLYSTILADVAAKWFKLRGAKTFFLTGTDEHGQKVAEAAQKAGLQPKQFVDSFIDAYKSMWAKYYIDYSHFIRTTDTTHVKAVQEWIERLKQSGDIYKAFYKGWYCTPCETFVTEKDQTAQDASGLPLCPSCSRNTQYVEEESYFFRLSAYQDKLLDYYASHPDFIVPSERGAEVLNFVKSGLKDLSISRTSVSWGIPFPGDDKHITYVWADALNNYITAIGYSDKSRTEEFDFWWPADLQVMGKDIVRFHAVYWPAFLMASGLEIPQSLLVHGWIKVNNQKMSKSFGNVVDPDKLIQDYGADAIRFYLTKHMATTQDAEFSTQDLEQRINSDLANDLGNLLNRVTTLAHKFDLVTIEAPANWGQKELDLRDSFWTMLDTMTDEMEGYYFYRGLHSLGKFVSEVNAYFHAQEPWKIAATDKARFREIISASCHSLHAIAQLLWPVMPKKMEELLMSLGIENFNEMVNKDHDFVASLKDNPWNKNFVLHKINPLFAKIEPQEAPMATTIEQQRIEQPTGISIDDFLKVELAVGTIEQCEDVPKSDKLLKLQVNFGERGMRQILSGVKKHFSPQDLMGKQAVFVFNLNPRMMMGLESHGMLLTAETEDKKLNFITVPHPVPNGTKLK